MVAHRGASDVSPEHTLAAYRRAVDAGADGLECDVRLTADGHLVCVHDRRIERTSNGRGVLSTMSLEELEAFDWGSWKNPWAELDDEAELPSPDLRKVLTLDELLATVRDAGRPVELAIETKHPTRYAGLVERRLIEALDRYGWAHPKVGTESPVRVMSFSWLSLRRMRVLAPGLRTVLLMDRVPLRFRDGSLPTGVSYAGPEPGDRHRTPRVRRSRAEARASGPRVDRQRRRGRPALPRHRRRRDHHRPARGRAEDPRGTRQGSGPDVHLPTETP